MFWLALIISLILPSSNALTVSDLKTGDVIVQSIPCYVCSMIELEEQVPYSHIGVVLQDGDQTFVLQSWLRVQAMTLDQTLAIRKAHTASLILRAIDENGSDLDFDSQNVTTTFDHEYAGLSYDEEFSWVNHDDLGEKFYCSEFVAKFLNRFLPYTIEPKPMHFEAYRSSWISYFHGTPPDGDLGISPADFIHSPHFRTVGEIPAN